VVAEVGRQPWIVHGLLRTGVATSTNVTTGMTYFTLLGFMGLYLLLGLLYLLLFARIVLNGPEHPEEPHLASVGTGGAA
jgi:cytochrome d ubiquinol oxidase subunit I